jgi:hypothetical protein
MRYGFRSAAYCCACGTQGADVSGTWSAAGVRHAHGPLHMAAFARQADCDDHLSPPHHVLDAS